MAKKMPLQKDPRLAEILDLIMEFAAGDLQVRGATSEANDELDALITGFNMLAEELEASAALLTDEQKRIQNYLDVAGTMMIVLNKRGEVSLANRKACQVLGRDESELLGKDWFSSCLPEQIRKEVRSVFQGLICGKLEAIEQYENPVLTASGEERLINWHKVLLTDGKGKVIGTLFSGEDITVRKRIEEQLEHQALHDCLTDLPNRKMILQSLEHRFTQVRRMGGMAAVLFIDLDDFKLVNDTLGHASGDELLRQVAERLKSAMRGTDIVARQGGDEFIVLVTRYGERVSESKFAQEEAIVAQRILEKIQTPFQLQENEVYVSASIGISLFPYDADDATKLIQHADSAMYQAKEFGRNNYQYYSNALSERQRKKMSLATKLHKAIEQQEFLLHYQPLIDLSSGAMVGVEALIRWRPENGNLVSPGEFLPVAEDSGLIVAIGDWVIREACRQLREWGEKDIALVVAVNLSVRQMWSGEIAHQVMNIVNETGVSKKMLEFEVTESAMIIDPERMEKALSHFKENDIKISLDDFGTGYSSLARLKHLPFDKLKIDKSFVDGIPHEQADVAIVTATVQMARSLGMKSLAEGVETVEQYRYLKSIGCDFGQGYYFSKPVPAPEIEALFQQKQGWELCP